MSDDEQQPPHLSLIQGDGDRSASADDDELAAANARYRAEAVAALLEQLPLIAAFAPDFPEEHFPKLAQQLVDEQLDLFNPQVLPQMIDPQTSRPLLMIEVLHQTSKAIFPAYKRIDGRNDAQLAIAHACAYAFLTQPLARALLRMHGYVYNIAHGQDPQRPPDPPLVVLR